MLDAVPSLRHLQALEAVARLNSITRAAAEIHLTQPAVTQTIAKLEAGAGAPLFERRITGTYLTKAGQLYLEATGRLFRGIEDALRQISPCGDHAAMLRRMGKITRAQVRALIAISKSQSQAQAANFLGISQASLHRAARDLECNVGATLYHRAATGVMTTDAGDLLASRFQLAAHEIDEICDEIRAGQDAVHRCVRFGALMLDPATLLGSVMVQFTRCHPDTIVRAVHAPFAHLRHQLRAGSLDFIVGVLKAPAEDLVDVPLFSDPYVIVARQGHPLTRKKKIGVADLLEYDWVVANQGAPRHAAFSRLFASVGRAPTTTIETHSLATIRMAVTQSDRLTLLTRSELRAEEETGLFAALPYPCLESVPVIGITTRQGWVPCEEKQAFLDLLHEHARAFQDIEADELVRMKAGIARKPRAVPGRLSPAVRERRNPQSLRAGVL
ncbi:LysR family transcriptional regulator [Sphingobium boeckii]|uniref:DNA-binding transcriptional LysR family regulator n=1 Tax=Sphingobium boeckii TaxID=1082345 RepID=A0A7W9AL87_9SPHN|nr:LysR family transcriptional regulator [Sphingobium boeckii]MBB5687735.1 DNA-binding transcriptional LysR family regulator [Sphingobium boeckii]